MERNAKQTVAQEWRSFSNDIQADVNNTLEAVQVEIEAVNLRLAELHVSDPEQAGKVVQEIIEYLDDRWGYSGDVFHVTGKWQAPFIGVSGEGILVQHREGAAFTVARSNGFMVKILEDEAGNEAPRVGLSFIATDTHLSSPSIQGHVEILAFAEPQDVTLQYMRPGDTSVVSGEVGEIGDTLMRADSLLYLYMNHDNSVFYRQNAKGQERFIQSVLDSVQATLPAPDSLDKLMLHDSEVSTMFVRQADTKELINLSTDQAGQDCKISGQIMGVTTTDILVDGYGKRYESKDDTYTAGTGLTIIVKPYTVNFPYEFEGYCYIPIRAMNTLSISLE